MIGVVPTAWTCVLNFLHCLSGLGVLFWTYLRPSTEVIIVLIANVNVNVSVGIIDVNGIGGY